MSVQLVGTANRRQSVFTHKSLCDWMCNTEAKGSAQSHVPVVTNSALELIYALHRSCICFEPNFPRQPQKRMELLYSWRENKSKVYSDHISLSPRTRPNFRLAQVQHAKSKTTLGGRRVTDSPFSSSSLQNPPGDMRDILKSYLDPRAPEVGGLSTTNSHNRRVKSLAPRNCDRQ